MTFVAHGLTGAAIEASFARAIGAPPEQQIVAAVHGFIGGILPDAVDWVAHVVFGTQRWKIYGEMHHGWKFFWLSLLFPMFLVHTLTVDPPFHDPTKPRSWWARLWWAEVLGWVLPIGVLVFLTTS